MSEKLFEAIPIAYRGLYADAHLVDAQQFGNSGSTPFTFVVQLDSPVQSVQTVQYAVISPTQREIDMAASVYFRVQS